jgi:hypothetical protein
VDDVCDGLVTVTVGEHTARARLVRTPPDFAPDRRPFTSLADGLTDRVKRAEVRDPAYISENLQLTALEVRDLFERALEAMDSVNVDAQSQRATGDNIRTAQGEGSPIAEARARTFPTPVPLAGITLALTERGRRKHRRFPALEILEDLIREHPNSIQQFVRPPATEEAGLALWRRVHDLLPGRIAIVLGPTPGSQSPSANIVPGGLNAWRMQNTTTVQRDDDGRVEAAVLIADRADYLAPDGVIDPDVYLPGDLTRSLWPPGSTTSASAAATTGPPPNPTSPPAPTSDSTPSISSARTAPCLRPSWTPQTSPTGTPTNSTTPH